ncbi:MAG: methyl-accepting chemotaxis protein, partial [Geobacter sp.]
MAATLSIKKRVNLTVICLSIVSIAVIGGLTYKSHMGQLQAGLRDLAENQNRLFDTILSADADGLARARSGLTRLDSLLGPFAEGKKDALLT